MTIKVPWLNRTFDFGFPTEDAPTHLARIETTPDRLERLLRDVPRRKLVARRGNAWSIQEHVGHLHDLELLHLGRLDDYDNGVDFLRAADMSNRRTEEAGHNDRELRDVLRDFRRDRETLVRRLHALLPERFGQTAIHPRLNIAMRIADMVYFVAEHDDHHVECVRAALSGELTAPAR